MKYRCGTNPRYVPDVRDNPGKIGLRFTERPRPGPMDSMDRSQLPKAEEPEDFTQRKCEKNRQQQTLILGDLSQSELEQT